MSQAGLTPEQLVSGAFDLVSLPELYFQVDEMVSDPRYTADDIGEVILSDPAMTAKLLKIVNSAFYGFPVKIETLTRAVTIVGMDELRSLILASSAIYEFNKIPNDLVDMSDFWMHSIHCGVIAKSLAKKGSVLHSERLFIAGLLHELGSLLIYNKLPDQSREILSATNGDKRLIPSLEKELLGFTHADVSAAILEKWELSPTLIDSTKFHLAPEKAKNAVLEAHFVFLANLLSGVEESGDSLQGALAEITDETWSITGLSESDVLEVMEEAPEQLMQLFGLMVPSSAGQF
jgi:HD-like signal output (HDOD) protein